MQPALELGCGKQIPSASILFFHTHLVYVPDIKMQRRVWFRSVHHFSTCKKNAANSDKFCSQTRFWPEFATTSSDDGVVWRVPCRDEAVCAQVVKELTPPGRRVSFGCSLPPALQSWTDNSALMSSILSPWYEVSIQACAHCKAVTCQELSQRHATLRDGSVWMRVHSKLLSPPAVGSHAPENASLLHFIPFRLRVFLSFFKFRGWWDPNVITGLSGWWLPN